MKNILWGLMVLLVTTTSVGCDDDDPSDVADDCQREAAFKVDGEGICATGTFLLTASETSINLTGEDNQTLLITVTGVDETTYPIAANEAVYIDVNNVSYASVDGGTLTIRDNVSDMDASFSFRAESADGVSIEISEGVVEDLPSR